MRCAFFARFALTGLVWMIPGAPALAQDVATCQATGHAMLTFQSGVNGAVLAAAKAGLSAQNLPRTRSRSPLFRSVESDAAEAEAESGAALSGLGSLVGANFSDPDVQKATDAVTVEGRVEIQEALVFSRFALAFERTINTRNIVARRAAFAAAMESFGSSTSTSQTYGVVGGQSFSATTTTTAARPPVIRLPQPDATLGQMQEALIENEPQIEMLPYTFNPLVGRWVTACRAAHELPPPPTASP